MSNKFPELDQQLITYSGNRNFLRRPIPQHMVYHRQPPPRRGAHFPEIGIFFIGRPSRYQSATPDDPDLDADHHLADLRSTRTLSLVQDWRIALSSPHFGRPVSAQADADKRVDTRIDALMLSVMRIINAPKARARPQYLL